MLREIYCRQRDDKYADNTILDHSNVYESLLTKIRMILTTERGSVLGDPGFGVNLQQYIFETGVSAKKIEGEIFSQIDQYIPESKDYDIKVNVSLKKGVTYDTGIVDISINGDKLMSMLVN